MKKSQISQTRDSRIIASLKARVLSHNPSIDPSFIEQQIPKLLPSFKTPSHPPYALMIQEGLKGLNEENGSTEEAISGFIKKEFQDLPVFHSSILGVQLKKLCEEGEIFCNESGRYVIVDDCGDDKPCEIEKKVCKGRGRKKGKRGRKKRCMQEANVEMNDNISMGENMNMEPCMVEKQDSMSHIPCEKQPDNLTGGETLERNGAAESCNELQEHMDEGKNHLSEMHGKESNEVIEDQGECEVGQLGVTDECHVSKVQRQGEVETQQNDNIEECENQIEATTKRSSFCSDGMGNIENLSASDGSLAISENQCDMQPDKLLAEVENQSLQIEVTNEMSRFCLDEISNNEYLIASPANPTVSVFPMEKLRISDKEQDSNLLFDFSELLAAPEGPEFNMETLCSSLPTAPAFTFDLTSHSQSFMAAPFSTVSYEHTQSEGTELTPTQLQVQTSWGAVETDFHTATKTLDSMTIHGHKQPQDDMLGSPKCRVEENTTFGDMDKHMTMPPCIGLQPMEESFADYQEVSLLPPDGGIDKTYEKALVELELRLAWERLMNREPDTTNETGNFSSSLNGSANQLELVDPTYAKAVVELELRLSWERLMNSHSGTTCKTGESSSLNGSEDKPKQHRNKGGSKRKLHVSGKKETAHLNQKLPRRSGRGRRPNPVPTQDSWSWVPVESSNNDIHSEENPNFSNTVKPWKLKSSKSFERHCEPQDSSLSWVPVESSNNSIHGEGNQSFFNTVEPNTPDSLQSLGFRYEPRDFSWSLVPFNPSNNGIHIEKNTDFSNTVEPKKFQFPESFEGYCKSLQQHQSQPQVHSAQSANDNNPSWEQTQMILPPSSSDQVLSNELLYLNLSNAYQNNQIITRNMLNSRCSRDMLV